MAVVAATTRLVEWSRPMNVLSGSSYEHYHFTVVLL